MNQIKCNPKYIVYDMRNIKDFKLVSISGYKKNDVSKAFQSSLMNSKLEEALRWGIELHCTGMNAKIWEILYNVYLQYIHINNPHYYRYYIKRRKDYFKIIESYPNEHEIFSRNDQTIRNMYAEMISLCVLSKKSPLFDNKSIPKLSEKMLYDKMELKKRMMGLPIHQIYSYVDTNDPNEIKLGLNEIYSNIYQSKGNFPLFAFWIMWLERISAFKKKEANNAEISLFETHEKFQCIPTFINGLKEEYQTHWVWKIWKFLLDYKNRKELSKEADSFITRSFEDFLDDFKPAQYNRKKYLLYLSFYAIKNMIPWELTLYPKMNIMYQSIGNINMMYAYINQELTKNLNDNDLCKLEKMYFKYYSQVCVPEKKSVITQFVPQVIENTQIKPEDVKIKSREEIIQSRRLKSFMKNDAPLPDNIVNKIDFSVGTSDESQLKRISIQNKKAKQTYIPSESEMKIKHEPRVETDVVSKVLKQEELEKIREEKKNYKMKAFMDFIPTISQQPSTPPPQKPVYDYIKESSQDDVKSISFHKKYSMKDDS